MKNVLILFLALLIPKQFFAQNSLLGKWRISETFGPEDKEEYFLFPYNKLPSSTMELKEDGTFLNSPGIMRCGNDCYKTTSGKYKFIDNEHVQFNLNHILYDGLECKEKEPITDKDLGVFFIIKDSLKIRLIKSDGNFEKDKQKLEYLKIIDALDKQAGKVFGVNYLQRKRTKSDTIEDIVNQYLTKYTTIKTADVKILFTKKIHGNYLSILIEENNKYRYLVYDPYWRDIAMYDNGN